MTPIEILVRLGQSGCYFLHANLPNTEKVEKRVQAPYAQRRISRFGQLRTDSVGLSELSQLNAPSSKKIQFSSGQSDMLSDTSCVTEQLCTWSFCRWGRRIVNCFISNTVFLGVTRF